MKGNVVKGNVVKGNVMKNKKIWYVLLLISLILLMLIPEINAKDHNEIRGNGLKEPEEDQSELIGWKMLLANADTGETIEINSKEDNELVTQSVPEAVMYNKESDERKYYYETIAKIPNEKINVNATGTLFQSDEYDEKNAVEVTLGIYYSVGYYGVHQVIRYDGMYINFNVNDSDVKLSDVETGYIIKNGIGVENGVVSKNNNWNLDSGMKSFEGEKFETSPWVIKEKNFLYTRTYFSGTLRRENGETWDTLIIMNNQI